MRVAHPIRPTIDAKPPPEDTDTGGSSFLCNLDAPRIMSVGGRLVNIRLLCVQGKNRGRTTYGRVARGTLPFIFRHCVPNLDNHVFPLFIRNFEPGSTPIGSAPC